MGTVYRTNYEVRTCVRCGLTHARRLKFPACGACRAKHKRDEREWQKQELERIRARGKLG